MQTGKPLRNHIAGQVRQLIHGADDKRKWYAFFKACHREGDVLPALEIALDRIPLVANAEDVFLPLARILHLNGMHAAAVAIYDKIISCDPNARQTHSELLVHKQLSGMDEEDALREFDRWNTQFVTPTLQASKLAVTPREPDRPIRVGFVSNDFGGAHSLNAAMAPWFLYKERRRDSYILYSNRPRDNANHRLFVDSADCFVDIFSLSDAELDRRIRHDQVDILVDMIGHMDRNRLLTYARKPAPIIVSWIGIGMPTGTEAVDYFLSDDIRVPRSSIGRYRENVVYLPGTAMAWCPPKAAPQLGPVPLLRNERITFGSITRLVKIQRETIALWARALRRVPGAQFLLKDQRLAGANQQRLLALFEEYEIEPRRIICRSGSTQRDHLATYNDIDVVLDSFPQQGGISSLEALWMGVPVVSYCHSVKPAGRVGRFILETIGLPSLAVETEDAYVEVAAFLSGQPDKLAALRAGLRQRLARSPICDVEAFQRHVDAAFRTMWQRYCRGAPPTSFTVASADNVEQYRNRSKV